MVLVDGVVAEVHARVPQILPRVIVLHGRKPEKQLFSINPDPVSYNI